MCMLVIEVLLSLGYVFLKIKCPLLLIVPMLNIIGSADHQDLQCWLLLVDHNSCTLSEEEQHVEYSLLNLTSFSIFGMLFAYRITISFIKTCFIDIDIF